MLKNMLTKPYMCIGTLIVAGIIVVTSYNTINANSEKVVDSEIRQVQAKDYSEEILELKNMLENTNVELAVLKERVVVLEESNIQKDTTINSIKSKINVSVDNSDKISSLENQLLSAKQELEVVTLEKGTNGIKIQELAKKRVQLQEEATQLQNELNNLLEIYNEKETQLLDELERLNKELKSAIQTLANVYGKVKYLEEEVEECKKYEKNISLEINKKTTQLENIRTEKTNKIKEKENALEIKLKEIDEIAAQMAEIY
jgi:chromosome segregation ATPase